MKARNVELAKELSYQDVLEIFALMSIDGTKDMLNDMIHEEGYIAQHGLPTTDMLINMSTVQAFEVIPDLVYEDMTNQPAHRDEELSPLDDLIKSIIRKEIEENRELRTLKLVI